MKKGSSSKTRIHIGFPSIAGLVWWFALVVGECINPPLTNNRLAVILSGARMGRTPLKESVIGETGPAADCSAPNKEETQNATCAVKNEPYHCNMGMSCQNGATPKMDDFLLVSLCNPEKGCPKRHTIKPWKTFSTTSHASLSSFFLAAASSSVWRLDKKAHGVAMSSNNNVWNPKCVASLGAPCNTVQ